MPDSNGVYSAVEIYQLLRSEARKHPDYPGGFRGLVIGTAIVMRESGGNPRAYRDASRNPAGGNDRGLWQFNSKYFPDVDDATAYSPTSSTARAYVESKGFTEWKPWDGATLTPAQIIAAQYAAVQSGDTDAKFPVGAVAQAPSVWQRVTDAAGTVIETGVGVIEDAAGAVAGWTVSLGRILALLLDPAWWRRIGVGALGFVLLFAAVALTASA